MRVVTTLALCGIFLVPSVLRAAQNSTNCAPSGNIQYVCGQEAPEDLVLIPGTEWVLASSYGGNGGIRLISVRDKTSTIAYPSASAKERFDRKTYDTCPGPPEEADKAKFTTHGLALRAGKNLSTLYAVHHGKRESIEVFEVNSRGKMPAL